MLILALVIAVLLIAVFGLGTVFEAALWLMLILAVLVLLIGLGIANLLGRARKR